MFLQSICGAFGQKDEQSFPAEDEDSEMYGEFLLWTISMTVAR